MVEKVCMFKETDEELNEKKMSFFPQKWNRKSLIYNHKLFLSYKFKHFVLSYFSESLKNCSKRLSGRKQNFKHLILLIKKN